jgi:SsrA-binding protein
VGREKENPGEKTIAKNKRASFEYELGQRYEAGLALLGSEVKMLRYGTADLTDAWCAIERGEAILKGVNIPVMPDAAFGHEAKRPRKLLLHAREIDFIQRAIEREGMTVVATRLYFKEGRAKVELALAKGKKKADKREAVKEREADRETRAAMARGRRGE